jgi:RNA polymerase sigma factor (sigma-70 family)
MIQLLKHLRSLREPAALQGWLRRIAVREALRLTRARARQVPVEQVPGLGADDQPGLRLELVDTLRRLRPNQRAVLVLRDLEGFTEAEAAALLEVQVGTVKSRLHRARRAFRDRWQP